MRGKIMVFPAVVFEFTVERAFTDYCHPITIPTKGHNDLRKLHLDKPDYRITYPNGETRVATMYAGITHGNEYYQLRVPTQRQRRPEYLKEGDNLIVILTRPCGKNLAILEYATGGGAY